MFWVACAIAFFVLQVSALSGIQVKLTAQQEQCFIYEATRASHETAIRVDVGYRITNPNNNPTPQVVAAVRGPAMVKLFDQTLAPLSAPQSADAPLESFAFNAVMSGLHRVCFTLLRGATVALELEMVGQNDLAPRGNAHPLDVSSQDVVASASEYGDLLESIQQRVDVAKAEMEYTTSRHLEFERTVDSAYIRAVAFTLINVVVVVGTCLWQYLALKQFFSEKKIV